MADPRFFRTAGPLTLRDAARLAVADLDASADPDRQMLDVAPLDTAGASDVSFFDNARYLDAFRSSKAGACVVAPKHVDRAPKGMALLVTGNPYRGYAMVAQAFYPPAERVENRHPTAVVDSTARIGPGTAIGPGAVIGARVAIGCNCIVGPNAVIADAVTVGDESEIGANAFLSHCVIGARCEIHAGVCIGNRGFGFVMDADGILDVPQLGRVIVEDDVEVGRAGIIDADTGSSDVVIGIAASGTIPFTRAAIQTARSRGALTISFANNPGAPLLADAEIGVLLRSGPEVLAGSTRLGAGTSQKAALGLFSTTLMVRLNKVYLVVNLGRIKLFVFLFC